MSSITELIKEHHKPELVDKTKSPNENRITMLFNDGEIMDTKGGWAFLQRSLFSVKPSVYGLNIKMPMIYNEYSYMIVENESIANMIRDKMIEKIEK